ncbi:MAG TPA: hypothetical protein VF602_02985 [Pedobacter sp.]|jgi:hypothetical protein
MQFEQSAVLLGVVGKKGNGTLDNGQTWATDRVELHVITPFSDSDSMAHGSTVTTYAVEDYAEHYERAKGMLQQEIVLKMEMIPAKKLGAAPRMVCIGFHPSAPNRKQAPQQASA